MAPMLMVGARPVSSSLRLSSPLVGGFGSVAPAIPLILLVLLCFPFKRKKRQLSIRAPKREFSTSQLIRVAKLEDEKMSREEKPSRDGQKGSSLPRIQAEQATNGFGEQPPQGYLSSTKDTDAECPNHRKRENSPDVVEPQGRREPCPSRIAQGGGLQFRKLPLTPREEHMSRAQQQDQSLDCQVYESIQGTDRRASTREGEGESEDPSLLAQNSSQDPCAGFEETRREEKEMEEKTSRPTELAVALPKDAPLLQPVSGTEEGSLSILYARVCKKQRNAAQQLQPTDPQRLLLEPDEEEPPPIPEKHFDIYEVVSEEREMQGSELPSRGASTEE